MGRIALAEDRPGEAVDWFEKAVKLSDKSSTYHLWLANALGEEAQRAQREKDIEAAERECTAAVAENPDSAVAHLALSTLYQSIQRWDDAFGVLDRLLAAKPDEIRAHYQIGRAAALSGKHLTRGEQSLKLWISRPPDDATNPDEVRGALPPWHGP
jgi:tetratricopeptide (TPR) repeat protein